MNYLDTCWAVLDIEIYTDYGDHTWAQAKYLAHSWDDVLWTNNIDDALNFLKKSFEKIEKELSNPHIQP